MRSSGLQSSGLHRAGKTNLLASLPVIADRVLSSSGDALREGILGTLCLALEEQKTMIIERLKSGVITVGHGRGFVVEGAGERLVITAAHCLPSLPPAGPSFGLEARTYV